MHVPTELDLAAEKLPANKPGVLLTVLLAHALEKVQTKRGPGKYSFKIGKRVRIVGRDKRQGIEATG